MDEARCAVAVVSLGHLQESWTLARDEKKKVDVANTLLEIEYSERKQLLPKIESILQKLKQQITTPERIPLYRGVAKRIARQFDEFLSDNPIKAHDECVCLVFDDELLADSDELRKGFIYVVGMAIKNSQHLKAQPIIPGNAAYDATNKKLVLYLLVKKEGLYETLPLLVF